MEGPDVFPFLLIFREEVDCLGLVLDFAFFAVLLVCIIVAAKRGFVLSLMELVGFFLAGACALSLSGLIAPEIYDRFFAQQVTQAIAARLPDLSGAATAAQQAHAALESLPDVIAQFAASLGIDTAALSADLSGAALAQTLADSIARPLVTLLCRLALFVGLILIFGILFRILAAVIDRFFHLPVLRTANAALGGVMGALKGLLVVLVAGVALQLAANLFASPGAAFQQTVESSFVMGMVRELLLVSGIAS